MFYIHAFCVILLLSIDSSKALLFNLCTILYTLFYKDNLIQE